MVAPGLGASEVCALHFPTNLASPRGQYHQPATTIPNSKPPAMIHRLRLHFRVGAVSVMLVIIDSAHGIANAWYSSLVGLPPHRTHGVIART
jgi:hypothetical protein